MPNRLHNALWLVLLAATVLSASATWQSASIAESGATVSQTGLAAYPVIGLIATLNLLAMFALRYATGLIKHALAIAIGLLSGLALFAPVDAALTAAPILEAEVEKTSGVAGWAEQVEQVLHSVSGYSFASYVFCVFAALLCVCAALAGFAKRGVAQRAKAKSSEDLWVN